MSNQPCLSEQDLKAFCIGQLDPKRSDEIVAHLSVCARCEETVAALDNTDDSLLQGVRDAANRQLPIAVSESAAQPGSDAAVVTSEHELLRSIPNPWISSPETAARIPMNEWIRDYELLEPLGQGGMGTVYKARHARLNRAVAIKLLPARRLRDAAAVSRFEREMKAIGCLDHPAIVRATDAGDAEGTHFLVMDFVDGIDLSQVVKLTGPMDVATACEVIRQAAAGLQYAHEQGLIHRDVKPGNLMVTLVSGNAGPGGGSADTACVKLLDLGLALFGAASEAVDELTTVGQLMGTLDYMAPEQADNCHDVDVRADVYSLGATLFKLLTGTAPYETSERQSPLRKMKALATVDAPPVQSRRPELLSDIAEITDRMLQREPEKRYQTAAEVARAVTPLCAGHQLVDRTQHALRLRAESIAPDAIREGEAPAEPPTPRSSIPPAAQQELRPPGMPGVAGNQSKPPRRRSFQVLLAAIGFFILLAAGVLFRIETDRGTLVIECAEHNVPVEIRQGNVPVKQLAVSAGMNMVTLRSGEYEVVLPTGYDSLHVESGKFELRRGDQWVARIVEEPKEEIVASEGDSGIYSPGNSFQPDPSPTASGGRPSSEAFGNDDEARKNTPERDAAIAPEFSFLSLQKLRDLYSEEIQKANRLNEESLLLVVSHGPEHPKVKDVSRRMKPVAERLQQLADAMSHRTLEPDRGRSGNSGVESSEPGNDDVPRSDSGFRFLDPLQQIDFEVERDRYALVMSKIPELRKKHGLIMEQLQNRVDQDEYTITLKRGAESALYQLTAALNEAEELRLKLDSMLEPMRLARQIEELLAVHPEENAANEFQALIPEDLIQKILKDAEEAERIRRAKNPEKTSQVFTTYPESLCRQILDLREEFKSAISMRQTLRESLRIEGRASLVSEPEHARRLIEQVRSANRECEQYPQRLRTAVAELKSAVAEEESKRTEAAAGSIAGGRAGDSGTEDLSAENPASPTFQGRTFDQWKSILTTERSDEELARAVEAIGTLGRGTREPEAIELILKVVEQSPPVTSDYNSAPKSVLAAVLMIRAFDADSVGTSLIPGFADRSNQMQAFLMIGLMNFPDAYSATNKEYVKLGESLPIRQAMISSEAFALELTRVVENRSGLKTGDPALTQRVFAARWASNGDMVPIYATGTIFEHIGKNKPGPELQQFLTSLLDHLAQTPQDQSLAPEAQNAALILARVSPNEKLAEFFIRRIREAIFSPGGPFVTSGGFGGFSHGRPNSAPIDCFEGLLLLGARAESAVPFMQDIIVGNPMPAGTPEAVPRPTQYFHEAGVLYLTERKDGDGSGAIPVVAVSPKTRRGFAVNLRLLAMEVIESSRTKDPKSLDLLRAELKQQLGQEPSDGPHELISGREFLLLRDDPNAAWKGPGMGTFRGMVVSFGDGDVGGLNAPIDLNPNPVYPPASPLDVELVNSTLLAWKSITGSWPRFAEPNLGELGNRTPQELGQSEVSPEKTLEFLPKFQPVAGLQP